MDCEICGARTKEKKAIEVDGSTLMVCGECASFGREKPIEAAMPRGPAKAAQPHAFQGFVPGKEEKFDLGLDLVQGYGNLIRKARERKGLTAAEAAKKIFEKESVLHRIESESIKPSDALIAKLQKELGIKLKEK